MGEPNFCVATANSEFIPAKFGLSSKTVSSRYLLRLSVIWLFSTLNFEIFNKILISNGIEIGVQNLGFWWFSVRTKK